MIYNFDDLSFKILSVGTYLHRNGTFEVDSRPYAAFSFRMSGSGTFEIDGKNIVSRAGEIIFIPAGMPYKVEYSSGESIVVHFSDCNYFTAERIAHKDPEALRSRFLRMLGTWQKGHMINQTKSYVYDILAQFDTGSNVISDNDVAECIAYIDTHFTEPMLNVEALCRKMHISRSSLQRHFNENFDTSAKQYILKLRMNRSMDLLISSDVPIQKIAYLCGFNDEKYFTRAFKQRFGYSPSEFKKKMLM